MAERLGNGNDSKPAGDREPGRQHRTWPDQVRPARRASSGRRRTPGKPRQRTGGTRRGRAAIKALRDSGGSQSHHRREKPAEHAGQTEVYFAVMKPGDRSIGAGERRFIS